MKYDNPFSNIFLAFVLFELVNDIICFCARVRRNELLHTTLLIAMITSIFKFSHSFIDRYSFQSHKMNETELINEPVATPFNGSESFDDLSEYLETIDSEEQSTSRFSCPLSAEDVNNLLDAKIPKSTKDKVKWAVNLFEEWLKCRNNNGLINGMHIFKDMKEFTSSELDYMLRYFILEVRNEAGDRYKSATLKQMVAMIQHFYNKKLNKGWSIFKDQCFQSTRNSLDISMKQSREEGVDRRKRKASTIEREHEETLWEKNLLGSDTPKKLIDTLVFLFGKNFAFRGRDEHRRLSIHNITKCYDPLSKRHYLQYIEDISKTSKGGLHDSRIEPKESRAYDNTQSDRCIVALYDIYMSHRPNNIDAFYLTPLHNPTSHVWYKRSPIGVNMLSKTVSTLFSKAGIDGFFTNHSLKRMTRTVLCNAGFGRDIVTKKTGHISQSELDYLEMNRTTQAALSDAINFCGMSSDESQTIACNNDTANNAPSTRSPTLVIEKMALK